MDADEVDGGNVSNTKKKGVKVSGEHVDSSDWDRRLTRQPISTKSTSYTSRVVSPHPHCEPTVSTETSIQDNICTDDWGEDDHRGFLPHTGAGVSKETMDELKSLLRESSILHTKDRGKGHSPCHPSYRPRQIIDCKHDEVQSSSFNTFKPSNRITSRLRYPARWEPGGASMTDTNRASSYKPPIDDGVDSVDPWESQTDSKEITEPRGSQSFNSKVEQIKQQIFRENIDFVRFEATDLHGVSRSKTAPAALFQEKAFYGVPMPRSYLELTASPKYNEVDHSTATRFSSDVLLIPDLSTFQALPWVEKTAHIICDPYTVTGIPLRTSSRLMAKMMLGHLQAMGFSIHSSFTYECCIFSVSNRVGPNIIFFPATTLLSNHDLPFLQQLVRGMHHMGVEVDTFASSTGPGQIEICFKPKFGVEAADSAFTFRTGIKEMARKYNYIATFLSDETIYNSGGLSHSLCDVHGRRNLFHSGSGELSEIGKKWLGGLLHHSPALSCLMVPGIGCRTHLTKGKDPKSKFATCGCNDNLCDFNLKVHGRQETHIDNRIGSAMANPYIVLAATIAAGLDGIKQNLSAEQYLNQAPTQQKQFSIPVKLEDALVALEEDSVIRGALGESFIRYFIAMKHLEIETQETDTDRNKNLEYFI